MLSANDRRMKIINILCDRRFEQIDNLAFEFDVANSTIRNDISILSLNYPIYTTQGKGGGIHVSDGYYIGREYLKPSQEELLGKLALTLDGVYKRRHCKR